ncbi:hypothetical protein [Mycolicibacter sinensis]
MTFQNDAAAEPKARRAVADLERFGVTIPAPVQAALTRLDELAATAPKAPSHRGLVDAILAGNEATVGALTIEHATYDVRRAAHAEAVMRAARTVSDTIREHRAPISKQLGKLAQGYADKITAASRITATLEALIRAGRIADAELVTAAEPNTAALNALNAWADRHLGRHLGVTVPEPAVDAGE